MASQIGSGYSGGDYQNSNFWNGEESKFDIAKTDSPDKNKSKVDAATINDVAAEVVATQKVVGAGAKGSQSTVEARLDHGIDAKGNPFGVRSTKGYDSLDATIKDDGSSAVAGEIQGEPAHTESLDIASTSDSISPTSKTKINFPPNFKIDRTRTSGSGGAPIFYLNGVTDQIIDGGEIDGNAANNGYYTEHDHGCHIESCSRVTIRNVYFHDHSGDGSYVKDSEDIVFENCIFYNPNVNGSSPLIGRNGVSVVASGSNTTKRIKFINCTFYSGNPAAVDIEPNDTGTVEDVILVGCHLYGDSNNYRGVAIEPASGRTAQRVIIANCTFKNFAYGVIVAGAGSTTGIVIINNSFYHCDYGVYGNNAENAKINGNWIENSQLQGILFTTNNNRLFIENNVILNSLSHGINMAGTSGNENTNISIRGNSIWNSGQDASGTKDGILCAFTDNLVIADNKCYDTQGASSTQRYGIQVTNSDEIYLDGNDLHDNTTSDKIQQSSNTKVCWGINKEGEESILEIVALRDSSPAQINAANGSGNDMIYLNNTRSGATKCLITGSKDIGGYYQTGVGYGKWQVDTIKVSDARINNASVPGNFAANQILEIVDASGVSHYVPAMAAAW